MKNLLKYLFLIIIAPLNFNLTGCCFYKDKFLVNSSSNKKDKKSTKGILMRRTIDRIYGFAIYNNNIYFGNQNGEIYLNEYQTSEPVFIGKINQMIWSLAVDSKGTIYVGSDNCIFYKKKDKAKFIRVEIGIGRMSVATDDKDNIYVGSSEGLIYRSDGTSDFFVISNTNRGIWSLAVNSKGNIYFGTMDGAVYKVFVGEIGIFEIKGTIGIIRGLTIDSKDNVYAGTYQGMIYFSIRGVSDFVAVEKVDDIIIALAQNPKGEIYSVTPKGEFKGKIKN